jgi:hypothetical protein
MTNQIRPLGSGRILLFQKLIRSNEIDENGFCVFDWRHVYGFGKTTTEEGLDRAYVFGLFWFVFDWTEHLGSHISELFHRLVGHQNNFHHFACLLLLPQLHESFPYVRLVERGFAARAELRERVLRIAKELEQTFETPRIILYVFGVFRVYLLHFSLDCVFEKEWVDEEKNSLLS